MKRLKVAILRWLLPEFSDDVSDRLRKLEKFAAEATPIINDSDLKIAKLEKGLRKITRLVPTRK